MNRTTHGKSAGIDTALRVFRDAVRGNPAYRDFIARYDDIAVDAIGPTDFNRIPATSKADFITNYGLGELVAHGDILGCVILSTSSGSSGTTTYWPRGIDSLNTSIELFDRTFDTAFKTRTRRTLVISAFAMGTYVGGTYFLSAILGIRRRGHLVSIITPGIEATAIIEALQFLAPLYDQVVIGGYPPFVKDVVVQAGDLLHALDIKFVMGGEAISESWRDNLLDAIGRPGEPERVCMIYGASDGGFVGYETASTIAIRRAMANDVVLNRTITTGRTDHVNPEAYVPVPTFVEYVPELSYVEVDDDGYLLFTIAGVIPLVRYRINDTGRVLQGAELTRLLRSCEYVDLADRVSPHRSYLLMTGRTDIAAYFYSINLFPYQLKAAFEDPALRACLTGKFILTVDADGPEPVLRLRAELAPDVLADDEVAARLGQAAVAALRRTSGEYRALHDRLGVRAEPVVSLHPFGGEGFTGTVKQRYTG